jgi:hypothetical protein
MADLVGAVRLPEGSMRATAGTEVVIDLLVFQLRADGEAPAGADWIDLAPAAHAAADDDSDGPAPVIQVNRYFAEHPEMVLGEHALGAAFTALPRPIPAGRARAAWPLRPC